MNWSLWARSAAVSAAGILSVVASACTMPTAPAVPTRWTPVAAPPAQNELHERDCPTSSSCYAVDGSRSGLVRWDGAGWAPVPVAPAAGEEWILNGVSCPSAATCLVSGTRLPDDRPLLLRVDGIDITDVTPALAGTRGLWKLACPSASWCAFGLTGEFHRLALWDGATGAVTLTALPADVQLPVGYALACGAPTRCHAIANRTVAGSASPQSGVVRWDGAAWTFTPLRSELDGALVLDDLDCSGPSFCAAVGRDTLTYVDVPLRYKAVLTTWSPSGWTPVRPMPAPAGQPDLLYDSGFTVSCGSPAWCVAVGGEYQGQQSGSLVYVWAGAGWFVGPARPGGYRNTDAVACARSERWCLVSDGRSAAVLAPS